MNDIPPTTASAARPAAGTATGTTARPTGSRHRTSLGTARSGRTRRHRSSWLAVLLAAALLGGCGTTDDAQGADATAEGSAANTSGTNGSATPAASGDDGCADDTTATATGPVELTDHFGRVVELDEPAAKVAALEWQQAEDVLTLCVQLAAVADVDGYTTWVSSVPLPEGVSDVGSRQEPSTDALVAAAPDLVIVEATAADDPLIGQIESLGIPVLATRGADATDPVAHMLSLFDLIAEATGRTERAEVVKAEFEDHLATSKAEVAELDLPNRSFVYLDGYITGGNISLRPFGQGSLVGELGEALGLDNAWTGEVDPAYGLGQTDIEGMAAAVGDANVFHTGTDDEEADILPELAKNPLWSSIPAVAEGRLHSFPVGVWTFGGPRSSQQVLDGYVSVLTELAG